MSFKKPAKHLALGCHPQCTLAILASHERGRWETGKQKVYHFIHTDLFWKCGCDMISVRSNLPDFLLFLLGNSERAVCLLTLGAQMCCLVKLHLSSLTTCLLSGAHPRCGGSKSLKAAQHLSVHVINWSPR